MGSCSTNIREFEDQSAIKGKLQIKWDKTKLVSHLARVLRHYVKRGERKKKKKKKRKKRKKAKKGMDTMRLYGKLFVYGFVWTLVCSISRV